MEMIYNGMVLTQSTIPLENGFYLVGIVQCGGLAMVGLYLVKRIDIPNGSVIKPIIQGEYNGKSIEIKFSEDFSSLVFDTQINYAIAIYRISEL